MHSIPRSASSTLVCLGLILMSMLRCAGDLSAQSAGTVETPAVPGVDLILWFDTEDYLLPADDDATLRLCRLLTQRGLRATFKMVGEKARVLERRNRADVIEALRKHDIGYHTDFHSVHPTPTEYLAEAGWEAGIAEFRLRESAGVADVRRIFNLSTLACYGQPGSSWAPQAVAALGGLGIKPMGIPCYVDEGSHVGWDGQPFWYAGALHVYHMAPNYTRMELHEAGAVKPALEVAAGIVRRLQARGGGLVSIFYHPCEWVHREFWDGVNFTHGANPPRSQWKIPPQRTAGETEAAFQRFEAYIDGLRELPGVHWITASDLPARYPDAVHSAPVSPMMVGDIAESIRTNRAHGIQVCRVGSHAFSAADQFEILVQALGAGGSVGNPSRPILCQGLLGPDAFPGVVMSVPCSLTPEEFRPVLADVERYLASEHRVPARVHVGSEAVTPADFLVAMAGAWTAMGDVEARGKPIPIGQGAWIAAESRVALDTPGLFGGWVIHRQGFRAPRLMELARLQAWTLKPAVRATK